VAPKPCDTEEDKSARDEAKDFLSVTLADGAVETNVIKKEAKEAGISWRTV
jgi:hypothetical protein